MAQREEVELIFAAELCKAPFPLRLVCVAVNAWACGPPLRSVRDHSILAGLTVPRYDGCSTRHIELLVRPSTNLGSRALLLNKVASASWGEAP